MLPTAKLVVKCAMSMKVKIIEMCNMIKVVV